MGLLKNGLKKTFVSTPLRVVAIPGRVAVPKAVVNTHKYYVETLKKARAFRCPYCGEGQIIPVTENQIPKPPNKLDKEERSTPPKLSQIWQCNHCHERLETTDNSIEELAAVLSRSGREYYENGGAYQDRLDALEDGRLLEVVESKIKVARGLRVVAIIAGLSFFFGVYNGAIMFCLTALLFAMLILMLGIMLAYRSWQLYTDNVFVSDPKEQFHWWLANEKWFAYPSDYKTSLNAYSTEDYYADEDGEYDYEEGEHEAEDRSSDLTPEQVFNDQESQRNKALLSNKFLNTSALQSEFGEEDKPHSVATTDIKDDRNSNIE